MKTNFKKYAALVLALACILGIARIVPANQPSTQPAETGSVDYVTNPEAEYAYEDDAAYGWSDSIKDAEDAANKGSSNKSGSKPVLNNTSYKYADGTTGTNFVEFLFDNLIVSDNEFRTRSYKTDTLVKSGVDNKMSGQTVQSNSYGTIDVTHANEGYVTLKTGKSTGKTILGVVEYYDADGNRKCDYHWHMEKDKTYTIPMYQGDGKYSVNIEEHKEGKKYIVKLSVTITVKSNSEYQTFLYSTRQADYENAPNTVAKAEELTKNCKTDAEKINVVYNWVYDNVKYDKQFVVKNYGDNNQEDRFNLDTILENGKGVCRHRSALVAGMLRSIGIPCRVTESKTHSWVQVWYETGEYTKNGVTYSEGAWVQLDTTSRSYAGYPETNITNYA